MLKPEFSVVIPVRNGEQFIAAALESVLNQTYQRFNIIVLENCSQDRTLEIIRSYAEPRITIYPAEEPLSIEENWERILHLDLLEYLTILGHDDLLYPDFLQEIVHLIEAEPEAAFYHTHFDFINAANDVIRKSFATPGQESSEAFIRRLHTFKEECSGSGWVVRSTDYKRVGGFPLFYRLLFSDMFFYFTVTRLSYKVCSPRYLSAFRMHEQSSTKDSSLLDFYNAGKDYLNALAPFQSGEDQQLAKSFVMTLIQWSYRRFLNALTKAHPPRNLKEIAKVKHEAAVHHLAINTFSLQWYEFLARLPWRLPRMMLFRLTNVIAIARKKMSIHLQTNIAGAKNP